MTNETTNQQTTNNPQIEELLRQLDELKKQNTAEKAPEKPSMADKILQGTKDQVCDNLDTFGKSVASGLGWGIGLALTLF